MRREIQYNPHKYLSRTPGGVQDSASQPLDPTENISYIILQVGCCVSASIGWCRTQNNIHADGPWFCQSLVFSACLSS